MIAEEREFPDRASLAEALAEKVVAELRTALHKKGEAKLAVSGGTTPKAFFAALSKKDIDWPRVTVTLVDERQVPETSERSNATLVRETLIVGKAANARFEPMFQNQNASQLPPFDAVILGMGNDGHTASFFPGGDRLAEALDAKTPVGIIAMNAPGAGEPRLTFTLSALVSAGFLALHIEGEEKRRVLAKALADGPIEDMPIRAVLRSEKPIHIFWCT
jgi:6-phosphogluconolactonase